MKIQNLWVKIKKFQSLRFIEVTLEKYNDSIGTIVRIHIHK